MQYHNINNDNTFNKKLYYSLLIVFIIFNISLCGAKINDKEEEVQYTVSIKDWPVPSDVRKQAERDSTYYEMTSADGYKYDCYIPSPPDTEGQTNTPTTPSSLEIDEVLNELSSSCILKMEGWWTYEFCYHKHFSQFHQPKEADKIEQLYYLGVHTPDSPTGEIKNLKPEKMSKGIESLADLPYYSEIYEDGTKCEIHPNLPRTIEVRYYCHEQKTNIISKITEPSTCTYEVDILTHHMCSFLAFKPKASPHRKVECFIREGDL